QLEGSRKEYKKRAVGCLNFEDPMKTIPHSAGRILIAAELKKLNHQPLISSGIYRSEFLFNGRQAGLCAQHSIKYISFSAVVRLLLLLVASSGTSALLMHRMAPNFLSIAPLLLFAFASPSYRSAYHH